MLQDIIRQQQIKPEIKKDGAVALRPSLFRQAAFPARLNRERLRRTFGKRGKRISVEPVWIIRFGIPCFHNAAGLGRSVKILWAGVNIAAEYYML